MNHVKRMLFAVVLCAAVVSGARADQVGRQRKLAIAVAGPYDGIELRDPRGRVSLIRSDGSDTSFAGCLIVDAPAVGEVPEGQAYTSFELDSALDGGYSLQLQAKERGRVRIETVGAVVGDLRMTRVEAGRMYRCSVRVSTAKRGDTAIVSSKIGELRAIRRGRVRVR